MSRKQTPDIMAELMRADKAAPPVSQQASKPAKRKASRSTPQPAADKVKATFYFTAGGLEALEASWMQLRQQAGAARGQVSRSGLVEVALLRLQDELRREKVAAEILQAILRVE